MVQWGPCYCSNGQKVVTLINSGAQFSSMSSRFCKWMALNVYPLDMFLELEGITEGTSGGNHKLETGPLQSCYVWVTPAAPQKHEGDEDAMKVAAPSITPDLTVPKEFFLDDVQGHVCTTWRVTIYLEPSTFMATQTSEGIAWGSTWLLSQHGPQATHFHGSNCYIWRITPRLLPGANLLEEPECPPHHNPSQSSCW